MKTLSLTLDTQTRAALEALITEFPGLNLRRAAEAAIATCARQATEDLDFKLDIPPWQTASLAKKAGATVTSWGESG